MGCLGFSDFSWGWRWQGALGGTGGSSPDRWITRELSLSHEVHGCVVLLGGGGRRSGDGLLAQEDGVPLHVQLPVCKGQYGVWTGRGEGTRRDEGISDQLVVSNTLLTPENPFPEKGEGRMETD